jgi:photosynthetic reaction center H subunit
VSTPKLVPFARGAGSPFVPTGNPMTDAVGPASYASRADVPDTTIHGEPKIVPMRFAPTFSIANEDPDPRGLKVRACDGEIAGTIVDIWVDRSEPQVRYYEVELAANGRIVLLPVGFVQWPAFGLRRTDHVLVKSITAAQFKDVPGIRSPMQITFLEEDKIMAYYAGGHLYATPQRSRPII